MQLPTRAALALALTLTSLTVAITPAQAESVTTSAAQDTFVDASSPTSVYGNRALLRVDGDPVRVTYLQFDVTGVAEADSIRLQVYAETSSTRGVTVHEVADNTWQESTMNFNNRPALGASVGPSGALQAGTWLSVDVSSAVTEDGLVTLALASSASTAVRMTSSEGTDAQRPRLVLLSGGEAGLFEVTRNGTSYTATSTTTTYTGTLKTVVEQAVADLEALGGGTLQFASGTFDIGSQHFEFEDVNGVVFAGAGMGETTIQNSSSASADTEPFDFRGAFDVTVRDMTVRAGGSARSTSDALDFDQGNRVVVENVEVSQSRGRGIVFDGKNDDWTSIDNRISGCVISDIPGDGIELLASSNNTVEGCRISNTGGHGIQLAKSSPSADQPNKKSNNNVIRDNEVDEAGQDGVNLNGGDDNEFLSNTITNSSDTSSGRAGIRIGSADGASCSSSQVRGNTATDTQVTKTQRWGLYISSSLCVGTSVGSDNDFSGNLTAPIRDLGTGTVFE